MAATELKNLTLGQMHQNYNKILKESLDNGATEVLKDLDYDDTDIEIMLKIDVACHNKNVDFILKVFKTNDMLYVSKAIQNSTWLITEKEYENIINPDYLNNKLFPEMTTKACIKLKKSIVQNLVDELRLQDFFNKEKCSETAIKCLLGCSIPFIEENIEQHRKRLKPLHLKMFCKKSISIFQILADCHLDKTFLNSTMFLIYTHTDAYLNVLERAPDYEYPTFNSRATKMVMKLCPERIINNFHIYANIVDIEVFAKHLPKENIKSFIYNIVDEHSHKSRYQLKWFLKSNKMLSIIKQMPKEERFKFVKEVFIDKIYNNAQNKVIPFDSELCKMKALDDIVTIKIYEWYQFASFEEAFEELKKLINNVEPNREKKMKNKILLTLLNMAAKDLENIKSILKYYKDKFKNEDPSTKCKFISNLIFVTNINQYDDETWNILNKIFEDMNVYEESEQNNEICVIAIILYKIIHAEIVPDIIEKKFNFNTLKSYCNKFYDNDKKEIFNYLYKYILTKIETHNIANESDFNIAIDLVRNYLDLLIDWEKELLDFPVILFKIRELIEIRQKNSWKIDLSSIYNVKKSWRKHMFEESLALFPSEKVCVNALKHDPTLFDRYKSEVELIRINEDLSLRRLLNKIRVFWTQSLSNEWKNIYLDRLNSLGNHKAVIRGLCNLLSQKQLKTIIKKYAPEEDKINWSEIDELKLSLQRYIAKNMHTARPQPDVDAILLYTKRDYLNYALPSLLAIFYNMSLNDSSVSFRKLLNSRVSLLKHVIRYAAIKLEHEDLREVFSVIWKSSKNASIRSIIFGCTFKILCNQKENNNIVRYSELLEILIENISSEEDRKVYDLFIKINELPLLVMPNILMKSYKLFQRLSPNKQNTQDYYADIVDTLAEYSRRVMQLLPSDFSTEIIQNYINKRFFEADQYVQSRYGMIAVMSAYFLSAKDMETQTERYEKVLRPLIQRCLNSWNETHEEKYFIKRKLNAFLSTLRSDLKDYKEHVNYTIVPNLFSKIYTELQSLDFSENYILLTLCKLTVELSKLLINHDMNSEWTEISSKLAPEFGKICLEHLKVDVKTYFPCIYVLFTKAMHKVIKHIFTDQEILQMCETLLSDKEFIQAYLSALKLFPDYINDDCKSQANTVKKNLFAHSSVEVKMHYYNKFPQREELIE